MSLPSSYYWLKSAAVGEILGVGRRYVTQQLAVDPSFPKAMRIDGGHPRWRADEVANWAERQRRNGCTTTK